MTCRTAPRSRRSCKSSGPSSVAAGFTTAPNLSGQQDLPKCHLVAQHNQHADRRLLPLSKLEPRKSTRLRRPYPSRYLPLLSAGPISQRRNAWWQRPTPTWNRRDRLLPDADTFRQRRISEHQPAESVLNTPAGPGRRGPGISQTLFDFGRRGASLENVEANYDATVASYRQTVLSAFQEVEDDLAALRYLAEEAAQQQEAVTAAEPVSRARNRSL